MDATEESGRKGRLINHLIRGGNLKLQAVEMENGQPRIAMMASKDIRAGGCGLGFLGLEFHNAFQRSELSVLVSEDELLYDYGDRSKEALEDFPWLAN